jgi:phage gpG-like protein
MESGVIVVDVDDVSVRRALSHAIDRFGPRGCQALMRSLGHMMRQSTLHKFDAQRGPDGKWAELAPSTIMGRRDVAKAWGKTRKARDRAKAGEVFLSAMRAVKILQDTGTLKRSIHSLAHATEVDIGTALYYGVYHQEGAPRAHSPARPYLWVSDADGRRMEGVALNYLERSLQ